MLTDRHAAATLLRGETAQTPGFLLVQLPALERLDTRETVREGFAALGQTVCRNWHRPST
jgi:hypothetical protein